MDIVSHAGWGYAALRWRGRRTAWWGALAGAAPDLLAFVPPMVVRVSEHGWEGLPGRGPRGPGMWRVGGPPLPQEWADIYNHYYVYTHSLVILGMVAGLLYLTGKRGWLWLAIPYALHILESRQNNLSTFFCERARLCSSNPRGSQRVSS